LVLGEDKIERYLEVVKPDVVVFYGEPGSTAILLKALPPNRPYKLWAYIDQNYKYVNLSGLQNISRYLIFAKEWRMDINTPQTVLNHAPSAFLKALTAEEVVDAKKHLKIPINAPVFVSINRNNERKRLDLLLQAWKIYKEGGGAGHLLLHTETGDSAYYHLQTVIMLEKVPFDCLTISNGDVSDEVINIYYNVGDYGVNTSNGEGFGIMALEMATLGKPQLALDIGAYRSYLNDQTAVLLKPTIRNHRKFSDGNGAFTESTSPEAFAEGFRLIQGKSKPVVNITWDSALEELKRELLRCG
jgi:glycosyltransferase involved in cell wall biosynthesis